GERVVHALAGGSRLNDYSPNRALHSSRIALLAVAPTRVTPIWRTASSPSKFRTPPAAFTCTRGGQQRPMSLRASPLPPASPYPVEVFTKSAPTSPQIRQSCSLCSSCKKQFSKITLTIAFLRCADSTTPRTSSAT